MAKTAASCGRSASILVAPAAHRRSAIADDRVLRRSRQKPGLWRGDAGLVGALGARPAGALFRSASQGLVAGANWADLHTYLPDDLMVKVDVASDGARAGDALAAARPRAARMGRRIAARGQDGTAAHRRRCSRRRWRPICRRRPLPAKERLRLPDRPMASARAEGSRLRHAAVAGGARARPVAARITSRACSTSTAPIAPITTSDYGRC